MIIKNTSSTIATHLPYFLFWICKRVGWDVSTLPVQHMLTYIDTKIRCPHMHLFEGRNICNINGPGIIFIWTPQVGWFKVFTYVLTSYAKDSRAVVICTYISKRYMSPCRHWRCMIFLHSLACEPQPGKYCRHEYHVAPRQCFPGRFENRLDDNPSSLEKMSDCLWQFPPHKRQRRNPGIFHLFRNCPQQR